MNSGQWIVDKIRRFVKSGNRGQWMVDSPTTLRRWALATAFAFLFLCTIHCPPSTAQTGLATLNGQITDPHGAVVPNAVVDAVNIDTGVTYPAKTNGVGLYTISGLIPGHYRVHVRREGFKEVNLVGLELHTQDVLQQNVSLEVGSVSESVTVESSGVNMNTTDGSVSTVIDRQFVEDMPLNGRSFQDLLTLSPGVIQVTAAGVGNSGELSVNGQRTESNYYSVDGVSATLGPGVGGIGGGGGMSGSTPAETALGTTQTIVSVDALQEFRATTSTYSAEYGRFPGGQFSFTTRSGTNDWHGSVFDYLRNEAFDANNWFNTAVTPAVPREKERQNDFGGTLGGPIWIPRLYNGRRDNAFFFFSYEGLRLWTPQGLAVESVPDQNLRQQAPSALQPILSAFPLPNKGEDGLNDGLGIYQVGLSYPSKIDSISLRIDHSFNPRFKVFGRYSDTPTVATTYSQAVGNNSIVNNRLSTIGATNIVTSAQSNELRFNVTQADASSDRAFTTLGGATPFNLSILPGPNGANFPSNGSRFFFNLAFGGFAHFDVGTTENAQRQYNVTDTYAWTHRSHTIKFGVDWRRLATYSTPYTAYEYGRFPSESAVLANNVGSRGLAEAISESPAPVEPLYVNLSAFVQDEWRATRALSLSLGLRWDVNPAPSNLTGPSPYTLNQIADLTTAQLAPAGTPLWKTDWHALAPRIGMAYQIRQGARLQTVLRGGFGLFYDPGEVQGSDGFNGIGFQSIARFSSVSLPLTSAQMTLPPPSVGSPYTGIVYAFDPNLKLPYTFQWSAALEQALGVSQALTITYVGAGARQLTDYYSVHPRNNPNFLSGAVLPLVTNGSTSDYDALQIQFDRKLSDGLQALASYTWSHSIDDASSNFGLAGLLERANSDFDVRHNFQAAVSYSTPSKYSNPMLSALLGHWALDARLITHTALPVDIQGNYYNGVAEAETVFFRPNLVEGQPLYIYGSDYPGGKLINYMAFNVPQSGPGYDSEGNTPRNYARALGTWQLNTAVRREFPIYEQLHLQFRAEAFNIFNHPNFANVNSQLSAGPYDTKTLSGFGAATTTPNNSLGNLNSLYQTGGPRSLQLAMKVTF